MASVLGLSKSKYCKGIQCPKILWLDKYKPEEAENVLPENVLSTGNMVGELARQYFGDYSLVEFSYDKEAMVSKTKEFISQGAENIAEASFMTDGLYCAVDILHKNGDGWDIVEVKSSTKVSNIYVEDMAFQYYVLRSCGVNVKNVYNMHINSSYVRNGALELKALFTVENYTAAVKDKFDEVKANAAAIRDYINTDSEPQKDIDLCCEQPYECAYRKYCGKHIPQYSVFDMARMHKKKKYELYHKGIISYEDILKNPKAFSAKELKQAEAVVHGKPDEYDAGKIREFLDTLSYPIYHLDFETFQQAIPEFDGCSPYEQIPFQYSLHIEYEDGRLVHKEFLAKEGIDPRRSLAESLIRDIPMNVCSTAYNMTFEKTVLGRLAENFPDIAEQLMNIHDNMHDLMIPFQQQHYYSAAMNGSYSIKYVLPALFPEDPELDYHSLEGVHNGTEASAAFADITKHTPEEIAVIRANLLKYCGLDTYAMVKVLGRLREAARQESAE